MTSRSAGTACIVSAVSDATLSVSHLTEAMLDACAQSGLPVQGSVRQLGWRQHLSAIEADIILSGDIMTARQTLEAILPKATDVALLPASVRRKRLLISDMDSTIIEQECLDELAAYAGIKDEIAAITARAMAGELNFEEALSERVSRLQGLAVSALEACYHERISLMPGARQLVRTMAANGAHCLLVSGGFTYFTERIAERVGFHAHQGNVLVETDGTLSGEVVRPILGREAKLTALDEAASRRGLARTDCLAMGDGANDLAMIEAAGLGLAVHAKPLVAAAADAAVQHTDLTTALYFQGYTDAEIIWNA